MTGGLVRKCTSILVKRDELRDSTRIFRSQFVDAIKKTSIGVLYKSRLVARNFGDDERATVMKNETRVQRITQRYVLSLISSVIEMSARTRDITQESLQSTAKFECDVCIVPPKVMCVPRSGLECYQPSLWDSRVRITLVLAVHCTPHVKSVNEAFARRSMSHVCERVRQVGWHGSFTNRR